MKNDLEDSRILDYDGLGLNRTPGDDPPPSDPPPPPPKPD